MFCNLALWMMLSITFQLEWLVYYFLQLSGANVRAKVGGGGFGWWGFSESNFVKLMYDTPFKEVHIYGIMTMCPKFIQESDYWKQTWLISRWFGISASVISCFWRYRSRDYAKQRKQKTENKTNSKQRLIPSDWK